MNSKIKIFEGAISTDQRGKLSYVNSFSFTGVKRFYTIENIDTKIKRAFHGHLRENKYFFVARGKFLLCAVKIDNLKQPSKSNVAEKFILSSGDPKVVFIPRGYANGIKALDDNSLMIVFSTASLEESKQDDYRFPPDYWGEEVWKEDE